ncbi:MAG: Isochorismatase family protein, partial [Phycisphaerales bacterium]|nr:Isochorismatase family protein [Phycisphaerales bacterium]
MAWTKPIPPATRGRTYFLAVCCVIFAASVASFADTAPRSDGSIVRFLARSRSEVSPKSGRFEVVEKPLEWDAKQTALIICDLWDKHWCDGATQRVGEMAPRIDALAKNLRARGGLIVHAPSDTMAFYKDAPQRKRATDAPLASAPVEFHWNRCDLTVEPPLPIDDSDGGCDCDPPCKTYIAWKREHPAVEVAAEDAVSDQGREIYNLFVQRGIRNVLFCG